MTFDPTKPVQTRDGRKARIICTDVNNPDFPIVAVLTRRGPGTEGVVSYTAKGHYRKREPHPSDLINTPTIPRGLRGLEQHICSDGPDSEWVVSWSGLLSYLNDNGLAVVPRSTTRAMREAVKYEGGGYLSNQWTAAIQAYEEAED
jgi:hypothetical protein